MNVHRKTVSDNRGLPNSKRRLEAHVNGRIENLRQELRELPSEYTLEAYRKWWEIQDALTGLYDIQRRFLIPPIHVEPSTENDVLY